MNKIVADLKPGDTVLLVEGPKTIAKLCYLRDNVTVKVTFADGSTLKKPRFTPVTIV